MRASRTTFLSFISNGLWEGLSHDAAPNHWGDGMPPKTALKRRALPRTPGCDISLRLFYHEKGLPVFFSGQLGMGMASSLPSLNHNLSCLCDLPVPHVVTAAGEHNPRSYLCGGCPCKANVRRHVCYEPQAQPVYAAS